MATPGPDSGSRWRVISTNPYSEDVNYSEYLNYSEDFNCSEDVKSEPPALPGFSGYGPEMAERISIPTKYVCAIARDEDFDPPSQWEGVDQYIEDHHEMRRREAEDQEIAELTGAERETALRVATERRSKWDTIQTAETILQGRKNVLMMCAGGAASGAPSGSASLPLSSSKRRRWPFRLKRKRGI